MIQGPATTCAPAAGQMPPEKALRVSTLKTRFADTIFKAAMTLKQGDKLECLKLQQEKKRLEREQLKEKARVEAARKAAIKMRRERERAALDKMKKTIDIYDGAEIMRDFEILIGASSPS